MPNWCVANLAIRGDKKELKKFVDMANRLPETESRVPNGFGRWWLGNLVIDLDGDWENIPCRGNLLPNPWAIATWTCPEPEEGEKVEWDGGEILRLSVCMAWDVNPEFFEFLKTKFLSFEFFYKKTDEFGSFHLRHDPGNLIDGTAYEIYVGANYEIFGGDNRNEYTAEQRNLFVADLSRILNEDVPEDISDEDIQNRIETWNAKQMEKDESFDAVEVTIWENK